MRYVACTVAATMKSHMFGAGIAIALTAGGCVLGGGDDGGSRTVEIGECAPPEGATTLALSPVWLDSSPCLDFLSGDLAVVDSVALWDALFTCPTPVPDGLDFATQRVAVVQVRCTPLDARFVAETSGELVVGIYQRISGACLDAPLVMPLPRSAKPVRLARCQQSCEGDCPPVP